MTAKASADATPGIKPTFTTGPEATTSTIQKDVEARTTADEKIAAGTATMKVATRTVAATKGVDVTAVAVTDAEKDVDTTAVQKVVYNHGRKEQHVDRPEGRRRKIANAMMRTMSRKRRAAVQFTWDEVSDNSEDKGHLNPLDRRHNDDDDSRANVDLSFGEDEAEEAHDHEQEVENLVMTADDVLDVESADEEQQDILASTKDD